MDTSRDIDANDYADRRLAERYLDDQRRIRIDVQCVRCDYNLRTLHVEARCPECNSPVAESLHADSLSFAPYAWVKTIAGGTDALAWGLGGGSVLLILSAVTWVDPELIARLDAVGDLGTLSISAFGAVSAILVLAGLTSVFEFPSRPVPQTRKLRFRKLAASCLVSTLACGGAAIILAMIGPLQLLAVAPALFCLLPLAVLPWVMMRHLAGLLTLAQAIERARRARLAARIYVFAVVWCVTIGGALILVIRQYGSSAPAVVPWFPMHNLLRILALIPLVVAYFAIWWAVFGAIRPLHRAAELAREREIAETAASMREREESK